MLQTKLPRVGTTIFTVMSQLAAEHELHEHVEAIARAHRRDELDHKGVLARREELHLVHDVALLLHLHYGRLLQLLHRVHLTVEVFDASTSWYQDADTPSDLPPGAR